MVIHGDASSDPRGEPEGAAAVLVGLAVHVGGEVVAEDHGLRDERVRLRLGRVLAVEELVGREQIRGQTHVERGVASERLVVEAGDVIYEPVAVLPGHSAGDVDVVAVGLVGAGPHADDALWLGGHGCCFLGIGNDFMQQSRCTVTQATTLVNIRH